MKNQNYLNAFSYSQVVREEFKDATDRSCVIVAGSLIDQILQEILTGFLIQDSKSDKEIFNGFGPLSSFSAKIKLSYRLGLISIDEYQKLEIFRSIRNKFAHEIENCTLDSKDLQDKLSKLIVSKNLLPPELIPIPAEHGQEVPLPVIEEMNISSPRDVFEKFIHYIVHNLSARMILAVDNTITAPEGFNYSYEPMLIIADSLEKNIETISNLEEQYKVLQEKYKKLKGEYPESSDDSLQTSAKNEVLLKTVRFVIERTKLALKKA